jgi:hypothetical protein
VGEARFTKLDIAKEYLDAAIEFYLARRYFFCAIHLAGAAEELLGAHLPEEERGATRAWKAQKALHYFNTGKAPSDAEAKRFVSKWKNEVKHMKDRTSPSVMIDPIYAAKWHINRAPINLHKLGLPKSSAVWRFEDYENKIEDLQNKRVDTAD